MGYVRVRGTVANPSDHDLKMELESLVDTGAIYTVIPKGVAERLKLKDSGKRKFRSGSGVAELPVSEAFLSIDGEDVPVLLGVTTLELLGFAG